MEAEKETDSVRPKLFLVPKDEDKERKQREQMLTFIAELRNRSKELILFLNQAQNALDGGWEPKEVLRRLIRQMTKMEDT